MAWVGGGGLNVDVYLLVAVVGCVLAISSACFSALARRVVDLDSVPGYWHRL